MNNGLYSFPKRKFDDIKYFDTDLSLISGGSILVGDIVANVNGSNIALPNSPIAPWASSGLTSLPTESSPDVLQGSLTQSNASTTCPFSSVAAFSDGSFVVLSGTNTGTPSFSLYNSSGVLQGSLTTVESVTPSWPAGSVCVLPSTDFVVAYTDSSSQPKFARYNKSGVLQGSRTVVEAVSSAAGPYVTALASGGFVITYQDNGGRIKFARYDASGVLQGSITTVEANAPQSVSCAGLTSGDFIVGWSRSDNVVKFARYNSSGVRQNSITTVATATAQMSVGALPNGQFVVAYYDSATGNYLQTSLYSSSGTLVGTTSTYVGTSSKMNVAATLLGDFIVGIAVNVGGSAGPGYVRFSQANVAQSIVQFEVVSTYSIGTTGLAGGQLVISYGINGGVSKFGRYTGAQAVIFGVAVEPASSGNTFRTRAFGNNARPVSVKLRNTYGNVPMTFDHTSVGGAKGTVVANTALLKGL